MSILPLQFWTQDAIHASATYVILTLHLLFLASSCTVLAIGSPLYSVSLFVKHNIATAEKLEATAGL